MRPSGRVEVSGTADRIQIKTAVLDATLHRAHPVMLTVLAAVLAISS